MIGRVFLGCLLGWFCFLQTGCQATRYYSQAIHGHCRILLKKDPIDAVLDQSETSVEVKRLLRQVLELRSFADEHLGLPAGRHYLHYAELESPYVVWNVFAAPEFSLEAKKWWYPVVGRLSYRGYFQEEMAQECEGNLRAQGMDVFMGGVDAYSTLGWFKDPVLDTFLNRDDLSLADLIFHELAHQKLFIKGDTDFNEAFATAVAREGVRRWLRAKGDDQGLIDYEVLVARQDAFLNLVMRARRKLEVLYGESAKANGKTEPTAIAVGDIPEMRRRKAEVLAQLRTEYDALKAGWEGGTHFDRWFEWPVNNARLNAESTYHELVPGFEKLLADVRRDLPEFFAQVKAIGKLPDKERQQTLAEWVQRSRGGEWTHHAGMVAPPLRSEKSQSAVNVPPTDFEGRH